MPADTEIQSEDIIKARDFMPYLHIPGLIDLS